MDEILWVTNFSNQTQQKIGIKSWKIKNISYDSIQWINY